MKKRFFDCDIWEDEWFMALPTKLKLLWWFLLSKCDNAGIWEPNWKLVSFMTGEEINSDLLLSLGNERVEILPNGKLLIKKFIRFQYGQLSETSPPHKHVKNILKANGCATHGDGLAYSNARVAQPLPWGRTTPQDKDKEKDKDKKGDARGKQLTAEIKKNLPPSPKFKPPTDGEMEFHANEIGLPVSEVNKFKAFYDSKGWRVGKDPMKNWRSAMSGWKYRWEEKRNREAMCKPEDAPPVISEAYKRYLESRGKGNKK